MSLTNSFLTRRAALETEIAALAQCAGRDPVSIALMAVSKQQPERAITQALDSGQRLFGENRVQEALQRWQPRRAAYPHLRLHLIGPLQTNKARTAVQLFDCIETLDRPDLVDALARAMHATGRNPECFIQVNTGEEEQKAGAKPEEIGSLYTYARAAGLTVTGLMCIPPEQQPPALHFALLRALAKRHRLSRLSMGMSGDYQKAVALGATVLRIGTALFGARDTET